MKSISFFILTFFCLYFSSSVIAQNQAILEQKVLLTVQNQSLETILNQLSEDYGVRFSYSNSHLPLQEKVTVQLQNESLENVLEQIIQIIHEKNPQVEIQFKLINGQVVLQGNYHQIKEDKEQKEKEKTQVASIPKKPLVVSTSENQATASNKKKKTRDEKIELVESAELDSTESRSEESILDSLSQTEKNKEETLDSIQVARQSNETDISEGLLTDVANIPVQISFVYPLGTNGASSPSKKNKLSINILGGYNGALEGIEVGGFLNILKKDMLGLQVAGFMNIVKGKTTGFQGAGFMNITEDSVLAVQTAGFLNINDSYTKSFQAAGFANVVGDSLEGTQLAGFGNIVEGSTKGVQIAGAINMTGKNIEGGQISGGINVAKNVKGFQIGIINRADTVRGSQVGIINFSDSISGVPIGLINFSKKGYRAFELSTSEGFQAMAAYNFGVDKFYPIVSFGIQLRDETRWGFGWGFGTRFPVSKNQKLHAGFEAMSYHLNEGAEWTQSLNMLNQLKFKLHYQVSRQVGVFISPTVNVTLSRIRNSELGTYGTDFAPYTFTEDTIAGNSSNPVNIQVWGGGFLGISF